MHILWLVKTRLPQAAAACGLTLGSDVSGGWLTGQLATLHEMPALRLTVLCVDAHQKTALCGERDGVCYRIVPGAGDFAALLQAVSPELVHIWGTEYPEAAAMQAAAEAAGLPVLIGIQGVMRDCAAHLCDGVPDAYRRSGAVWHGIDKVIPGELLDNMQARFDALAEREAALLARAQYVTGRTGFDRRAAADLAPSARYFACNETLRPAFYTGTLWHARDFGSAPVLFLPQGNYPLKNLHTALKALAAVRRRYAGACLHVAGWAPLDKGALLRPVIDGMFPYKRYCKRLAAQLHVADAVRYLGPLDAAAMRQAYLDADVFLLPSSCENSPNSLGEAMLLGLPCVVSNAGGIPDMLRDGCEGVCYGDAQNANALDRALCGVLALPDGGTALGQKARARALQTHDPARNADTLCGIYKEILGTEIN